MANPDLKLFLWNDQEVVGPLHFRWASQVVGHLQRLRERSSMSVQHHDPNHRSPMHQLDFFSWFWRCTERNNKSALQENRAECTCKIIKNYILYLLPWCAVIGSSALCSTVGTRSMYANTQPPLVPAHREGLLWEPNNKKLRYKN